MIPETTITDHVKIDTSTGCWLWQRYTSLKGYGQQQYGGKKHYAHRLSYQIFKGEIPKGLYILHSCDTPSCVNPSHLSVGTQGRNLQEMYSRGRAPIGERHGMARLCWANVVEIRELYRNGGITQQQLADKYGVSLMAVNNVVNNRSWTSQQTDKE